MFNIHYNDGGIPHDDFNALKNAQRYAEKYKRTKELTLYTSTSNIIEAIRVVASRGEIPYQEIQVHFNGEIITVNESIEYSSWPAGFMDQERDYLRELLEYRRTRSKNKEEEKSV